MHSNHVRSIFLALVSASGSLATLVHADDWPHWRGPNRDGVSLETAWSSVGRSEDLWRARVGMGYTSATISDGRLFTIGHDAKAGEDVIFCHDALTGAVLWARTYPAELLDQDHSGGTLTSPAVDGNRVYASSRAGDLRCLDAATGEIIWHRRVTEEHDVVPGIYGVAGSPVIIDDVIYINLGKTFALDKASGDLIWAGEADGVEFSTPAPFTLDGAPCLAVFGKVALDVLDQATGATLQTFPWQIGRGAVNASTPIPVGERIIISSAYNHGIAMIEFGDDGATAVWANKRMRNKMAGCVVLNGRIFGFDESMLKCLDLEGNEVWRKRGLGNGSLVAAGQRLIIMSSKGELIIADATSGEFRELSRERLFSEGTFWSPPVIADGLIYARSSLGEVVCRDHRVGGSGDEIAAVTKDSKGLPAAESLFARHLKLIGGADALRDHPSRQLRGQFSMRSQGFGSERFEIHQLAPDKWHAWIKFPGGRAGQIERFYDGAIGWELNPHPRYGDKVFDDDQQRELRSTSDLMAEADYRGAFASLRTIGRELFDQRQCHVVEAVTTEGSIRRVYFDAATGFMAGRSGATESIAVFDEYREFDGLMIATVQRFFEPELGIEEIYRVESVSFEVIDESIWEMPEVIRNLLTEAEPAQDP